MAEIRWKTTEEIEVERNTPPPPTVEDLKAKLEKLGQENEMLAIALMELTTFLLEGGK